MMSSHSDTEIRALLQASRELREQGRAAEALEILLTGERLFPDNPALPAARAELLNQEGRHREALTACWQALEQDAAHEAARCAMGQAFFFLGQLEEASIALDALVAANPSYPNAAWLRAGILRQRFGENSPEVLAAYDLTVASEPANFLAHVERADILRACGQYRDARDVYARIHQEPRVEKALRVEAAFKLGCVAMVLQENDTARAAFRVVLDATPDYPDAQALHDLC